MPLIGYARVSTEDQATDAQVDVLKAAGCAEIFREHMSGAKTSRPELAKALCRVDVIDEKQFVGKSMHYEIPCFVDNDVNREKFVGSLTFL